ncbi:MAG: hypothetical protein Q7R79_02115 [bacterium]|nr:hypothetical protein [bacterium]
MIASIISFLILIGSLAIIIKIIAGRWSALVALDVDMLPSERDARTKKKIVSERLRRHMISLKLKIGMASSPMVEALGKKFDFLIMRVQNLQEARYQKKITQAQTKAISNDLTPVEKLLTEADDYYEKGELEKAERRYIDAIAIDVKNLKPYKGLAALYLAEREWDQAREVLEYLCVQLRELIATPTEDSGEQASFSVRLAENLEQLAQTYLHLDRHDDARSSLESALDLQPQNPKFLDATLELYIILGKQKEARGVLKRLKEANPDNQKLEDFASRVKAL